MENHWTDDYTGKVLKIGALKVSDVLNHLSSCNPDWTVSTPQNGANELVVCGADGCVEMHFQLVHYDLKMKNACK